MSFQSLGISGYIGTESTWHGPFTFGAAGQPGNILVTNPLTTDSLLFHYAWSNTVPEASVPTADTIDGVGTFVGPGQTVIIKINSNNTGGLYVSSYSGASIPAQFTLGV